MKDIKKYMNAARPLSWVRELQRQRRALILTKGDDWDFVISVIHDATIRIERGVGVLPACIWDIIIDCAINQHGEYLSGWKSRSFLDGVRSEFKGRRPIVNRDNRGQWHKDGWGRRAKGAE
jgi:hypothetical protein